MSFQKITVHTNDTKNQATNKVLETKLWGLFVLPAQLQAQLT